MTQPDAREGLRAEIIDIEWQCYSVIFCTRGNDKLFAGLQRVHNVNLTHLDNAFKGQYHLHSTKIA